MADMNILIVEDDDLMQSMLKDTFSQAQYKVTFASDGMKGWETFQKVDFDLVLVDMKLPKMDGITLLKKIKNSAEDTLVIIMTGHGTIETAVEAMKLGAFDYITKPFLTDELILIIQKGLELKSLKQENLLLRKNLSERYSLDHIIGKSKAMQEIYQLIEIVAPGTSTVLIQGESGTGKEVLAEAIHNLSSRKDKPLIKVSCAALPVTLLESELFGHEKGAFTDAVNRKKGRFEMADNSTLFLDEIDDMSPNIQMRLLRVLQENEFERVGGTETIRVNVRVVAATKINLQAAIKKGNFRDDLYYRLNVVPILLPPLRERKEDIPLLVEHFLKKYNQKMGKKIRFSPKVLQFFIQCNWPGNIRELENMVERLVAVSTRNKILPQDLPISSITQRDWKPLRLKRIVQETEREHIMKVLELTAGNKKEAANLLGITTKTLWVKTKQSNI